MTQAVFLILARRAGSIRNGAALPAWLHKASYFAAANARRAKRRRTRHEHASLQVRPDPVNMSHSAESSFADPSMVPRLDQAIATLSESDRVVIVGRYLQGLSMGEVAGRLGSTTAAAQKRLERALVKLRAMLIKQGLAATTTAGVGATLLALPAQAAPAAVISSVTAVSVQGAAASGGVLGLVKGTLSMLAWAKLNLAGAIAAAVLVTGAVGTEVARQTLFTPPNHVASPPAPAVAKVSMPPIATLKSGITVELLRVSEDMAPNGSSWKPDGQWINPGIQAGPGENIPPDPEATFFRKIAYRVTSSTQPLGELGIQPTTSIGSVSAIEKNVEEGVDAARVMVMTKDGPTATVRIQIATGPWEMLVSDLRASDWSPEFQGTRLEFQASAKNDGTSAFSVRGALDEVDVRLGANERHSDHPQPIQTKSQSFGPGTNWSHNFNFPALSLDGTIDEHIVEARRYDQWVEFQNVSLVPGVKTYIQVETSDDPPPAPPREPSPFDTLPPILEPGVGIGPIKLGMAAGRLDELLGPPLYAPGTDLFLNYPHLGLNVALDPENKNHVLFLSLRFDSAATKKSPLFSFKTPEGIGIGSTRDEVIKAYGDPTDPEPWLKHRPLLPYDSAGVVFSFRKDVVATIQIFRPFRMARFYSKEIQGNWNMKSWVGPNPATSSRPPSERLTVTSDRLMFLEGQTVVDEMRYTQDYTQQPHHIDLRRLEPEAPVLQGIYQIKGDQLQICYDHTGRGKRPEAFTAEPDSGRVLMTLRWTRAEELGEMSILPGVGVGPFKFGMEPEQAEAILGPIEYKGPEPSHRIVEDWKLGLNVQFINKAGLSFISILGTRSAEDESKILFNGRTPEGIGIGSARQEVLDAYGEPESMSMFGNRDLLMAYDSRGVSFNFEMDQVRLIYLMKPQSKP